MPISNHTPPGTDVVCADATCCAHSAGLRKGVVYKVEEMQLGWHSGWGADTEHVRAKLAGITYPVCVTKLEYPVLPKAFTETGVRAPIVTPEKVWEPEKV